MSSKYNFNLLANDYEVAPIALLLPHYPQTEGTIREC